MLRSIRPYRHTTTCLHCGNTWPTRYDWKNHNCVLPVYGPKRVYTIHDYIEGAHEAVAQFAKVLVPFANDLSKAMEKVTSDFGKALGSSGAVFEGGRYYGSKAGADYPERGWRSNERGDERGEPAAVPERQGDGHRRQRRRKGH